MEEVLPDGFRLKRISTDQFRRHVTADQLARRFTPDLVVGDAAALETLVCCNTDNNKPNSLDLASSISEATCNRRGDEVDVDLLDPVVHDFCPENLDSGWATWLPIERVDCPMLMRGPVQEAPWRARPL